MKRKLLSVLLTAAFVLSLSVPAFAEESDAPAENAPSASETSASAETKSESVGKTPEEKSESADTASETKSESVDTVSETKSETESAQTSGEGTVEEENVNNVAGGQSVAEGPATEESAGIAESAEAGNPVNAAETVDNTSETDADAAESVDNTSETDVDAEEPVNANAVAPVKSVPVRKTVRPAKAVDNTEETDAAETDMDAESADGTEETGDDAEKTVEPETPVALLGGVESETPMELLGEAEPEAPTELLGEAEPETPVALLGGAESEAPMELLGDAEPEEPTEAFAMLEAYPVISVEIPRAATLVVNPYRLDVEINGDIYTDTILSEPRMIQSRSNMDLTVKASAVGWQSGQSEARIVDSPSDMEGKSMFVYYEFANASDASGDVRWSGVYSGASNQIVTQGVASGSANMPEKTEVLTIPAAEDENTPSYAAFRAFGAASVPEAGVWTAEDNVEIRLAFSFIPA